MSTRTLLSADEFLRIAEDLGPCELVRGEVVNLSPAGNEHGEIVANITGILRLWARQSGLGRILAGEAGVVTAQQPDTVRGADVAYLSYARQPRGQRSRGFLRTPPELVVEVLGRGRTWRELMDKTAEYLRMGVDRVWIVDPATQQVHIFRPDAPPVALEASERLEDAAVLPGFSAVLAEFFAD